LKIDYEKGYDRVSLEFLEEMLISRGFGTKWIYWIRCVVRDGSLCVRLNDEDSHHFKPGKGLRQGDPLSPLLFNLVANVFTRMLMKAADHNLIVGLMKNSIDGGIISLQYADDTILFLDNDLDKVWHLKLLRCPATIVGLEGILKDKKKLVKVVKKILGLENTFVTVLSELAMALLFGFLMDIHNAHKKNLSWAGGFTVKDMVVINGCEFRITKKPREFGIHSKGHDFFFTFLA